MDRRSGEASDKRACHRILPMPWVLIGLLGTVACGTEERSPGDVTAGAGGAKSSAAATGSHSGPSGSTAEGTSAGGGGEGGGTPCVPPSASSDCDALVAPGSDRACQIDVAGDSRDYLLYAPAGYDPCKPVALVVDAHGSQETDDEQAGLEPFLDWPGGLGSGWRLVADQAGFLVVQPQGLGNAWDEGDVAFMEALVTEVSKVATIDPDRVYLSGISNGGGLTYWTGCGGSGVFRGFAPVSGYGDAACAPPRPAPIIHFHSPDDLLVSISDGRAAFDSWVDANHCTHGPTDSLRFGGPSGDTRPLCLEQAPDDGPWSLVTCATDVPATTCQTWDQCEDGVSATFCTVPPDLENHYALTGGHILYVNGTRLSLAAVAWEMFSGNL